MLEIFNATIQPILTYGCEMWNQEYQLNINFAKHNNIDNSPLHSKVCKHILQVRANSSGRATNAELGSFRLVIFIVQINCNITEKIAKTKAN